MLEKVKTIEELIETINSLSDEYDLTLETGKFRSKSKELSKDDKEHYKVLHVLLNKMEKQFSSPSCRLLKPTKEMMMKHTAWTWGS